MKRTPFKRSTKPIKRGKLRRKSKSPVAKIKEEIQALLRDIVMIRDGKCILYGQKCNHQIGDEGIVWQAEHLIERSNSATYADSRLVVLVAQNCHFWKHIKRSNHDAYDQMVKNVISKDRIELWDRCRADMTPHKMTLYDWQIAKVALENELAVLKGNL